MISINRVGAFGSDDHLPSAFRRSLSLLKQYPWRTLVQQLRYLSSLPLPRIYRKLEKDHEKKVCFVEINARTLLSLTE